MEKEKVLDIVLNEQYFSIKDLRFNAQLGNMLSKDELNSFLETKDSFVEENNKYFSKLPLKSFNSKHVFFVVGNYLENAIDEYVTTLNEDLKQNEKFFLERHIDDIMTSRLFSEIEGNLNI